MKTLDALLVRALLRSSPEDAHRRALKLLGFASDLPGGRSLLRALYAPADAPVNVGGLRFRNRIGLAAGYDKNATCVNGLDALGFGHLELGTVTPRAQEGNPGVRIVRLANDRALVNRMGFPSDGMDAFARNLRRAREKGVRGVIGVNLGKNRTTANEVAVDDYLQLFERLHTLADYVTINVSSPNTKDLRDLQTADELGRLLRALVRYRKTLTRHVPLWVKLSPDASADALAASADAIGEAGCDAIVISNTTVSRPVPTDADGGLSGRPLAPLSLSALETLAGRTSLPLVAVGGIHDLASAQARLNAGAELVQVYTSLVYQGPSVLRSLQR